MGLYERHENNDNTLVILYHFRMIWWDVFQLGWTTMEIRFKLILAIERLSRAELGQHNDHRCEYLVQFSRPVHYVFSLVCKHPRPRSVAVVPEKLQILCMYVAKPRNRRLLSLDEGQFHWCTPTGSVAHNRLQTRGARQGCHSELGLIILLHNGDNKSYMTIYIYYWHINVPLSFLQVILDVSRSDMLVTVAQI
jgi:hypothetical protein